MILQTLASIFSHIQSSGLLITACAKGFVLQPNHLLCEFTECQDDVLPKFLGFRFWLVKTSWSLLVFHKAVSLFHASSIDVIRAFKTEICWSDLLLNFHDSFKQCGRESST
jgi:hypothetical protein